MTEVSRTLTFHVSGEISDEESPIFDRDDGWYTIDQYAIEKNEKTFTCSHCNNEFKATVTPYFPPFGLARKSNFIIWAIYILYPFIDLVNLFLLLTAVIFSMFSIFHSVSDPLYIDVQDHYVSSVSVTRRDKNKQFVYYNGEELFEDDEEEFEYLNLIAEEVDE